MFKMSDKTINKNFAWAVRENKLELAAKYIKLGADVNFQEELIIYGPWRGGWRCFDIPLINACREPNIEMVKLLIKHGVDVNVKSYDYQNKTALSWACGDGWLEMVELLIDNGADLNIKVPGNMNLKKHKNRYFYNFTFYI